MNPEDAIDRTAYPFTDKWMPLDQGRMHYVDEGEGEPVLFVHGTPTWSFEWRHVIRALAPEHRCIAPDHLGFGLSERPRAVPDTPEWHAQNLAAFVIHRQYLDRFPDRWSRGAVLWPLARAPLGSSAYYESLWRQHEKLSSVPTMIVWGMKDSAFRPTQLARWKTALPNARVVEIENAGHWPHEDAPERVIDALRGFLRTA